jgi:hypothetical protein
MISYMLGSLWTRAAKPPITLSSPLPQSAPGSSVRVRTSGVSLIRILWLTSLTLVISACGGGDESGSGGSTSPKDASADTSVNEGGKDAAPDVRVDAPDGDSGPTECEPKTCAQLEANCGSAPDGCGGKIECGDCPDGQACGGGGTNVCGTDECIPKSCVQVGAQCGWASDGCAEAVDCGGCAPPEVCGGGGALNECGCSPKTCSQLNANCGTLPDGCLGTLECGSCSGGQACGGGGPNTCGVTECVPKTCAQLGASCGFVSDGCSQALDCGECGDPELCGGGGVLNQCGCTPKSCSQLGASCGSIDTGCGDVNCGDCTPPDTCGGGNVDNQCGCTCTLPNATTSCLAGVCSVKSCDAGWGNCDSDASNGCELDISVDLANCGLCGLSCSFANASAVCTGGTCQLDQCNDGFADCDGDPSNGCEANLNADPTNCLTCGNECPAGGGTAVCVDGVCDVSDCNIGLGDCDDTVAGCETDVTSSAEHCAYCNNPCEFSNGTGECVSSTCHIEACSSGWGDCDGNESNGCETNTDTAVSNCGTCGNACPTQSHATATCANGACGFTCSSGWENCDGSAANGCEINLQTDVGHCGSCTNACSLAHATAGCTTGSCTIISCDSGWGDCNGNPSDGCEVNTNTSPNYCGSCGNSCSIPNGTAGCSSGSCTIASCNPGWANCDGQISNGCETNTAVDPTNCGGCGTVCNGTNGTALCQSGSCAIACNSGYGNCDGNVANGCEVNTTNSVSNCGGCGQACSSSHVPSPSCSNNVCNGACQAGYADCDGDKLTNGCETGILSNVNNCGGCGNVCSGNHVPTEHCTSGICDGACATGYADCNGNKLTDGCEINTATDEANCGSCNLVCSTNHVTASCLSGTCSGACASGWDDCNSNKQTDGCEMNTASNLQNCGTCGNDCTNPVPPQANSVACTTGSCTVSTCNGSYVDQNTTFSDGCECLTDSVANTCGGGTNLGTIYSGIITKPSATTYYNIVPTGDVDYFYGTWYIYSTSCNYRPRVELVDTSGDLRMKVYNNSTCTTGYGCSTAETGNSTKGVRTWDFGHSTTCGSNATIDPSPATGSYFTQSTAFRIQVYSTKAATSCQPYQLKFTRY